MKLQEPVTGRIESLTQLFDRFAANKDLDIGYLATLLDSTPAADLDTRRKCVALLKERAFSSEGLWQLPISKKAFRRFVKKALAFPPSSETDTAPPLFSGEHLQSLRAGLIRWLEIEGARSMSAQEADQAVAHISARLSAGVPVRVIIFVCPPVDYLQLGSDDAATFVLTDVETALVRRHRRRIQELLQLLIDVGGHVELLALVGDTDERDYLWLRSGPPVALCRLRLAQRRTEFAAALQIYLNDQMVSKFPSGCVSVKVKNLSELMAVPDLDLQREGPLGNLASYFSEGDLQQEVDFMQTLWEGAQPYYEGLRKPTDPEMRVIVRDKFITYALQGRMLLDLEPLLLIQTERPSVLRMKMLNAARHLEGKPLIQALQYYSE